MHQANTNKRFVLTLTEVISVLLPISDREDPKLIGLCLKSLADQAYKDFEVLLVTSENSAKKISQITQKYPFVKVLKEELGKSAARNFAAKNAKREYIFYIDADMELTPRVLSECVERAAEGAEAIITPKKEAPRPNFWSKCRALEREISLKSLSIESPDFIKKSLFEKVGRFDENLGPLDDWDLHLSLREMGVKFDRIQAPILMRESIDFLKMLRKKYERGRALSALREKYPHPPQLDPKTRIEDYRRNWKKLIVSPHLSLGLFILKVGDVASLFWGILRPLERPNRIKKNPYGLAKVAEEYDRKRLGSNFVRYKHFAELSSLLQLLPERDSKILEVGCGTGRITTELVERGYEVSPTDISRAMLTQYEQKPGLPKPQLADATRLPFPDDSFPTAFSLRVIWHLPRKDIDKAASEVARVSSSLVILDVTNKKRWPKIYRDHHLNDYFFAWEEFIDLCQRYGLKVEERIPLDTLVPFWLNFFPSKLATALFPLIYRSDLLLAKLIPPGRYLVKLSKQT